MAKRWYKVTFIDPDFEDEEGSEQWATFRAESEDDAIEQFEELHPDAELVKVEAE